MKNFPESFSVQTSGIENYAGHVNKGAEYLVQFFRSHPEEADKVLGQSYDKRYTPSTFIEEIKDKYRVGWYENDRENEIVFNNIEEAVTDYLLFSFGKGRYQI